MNITDDLLPLLRCPITHQPLADAGLDVVEHANRMIEERKLTNRLGESVEDTFDGGLVNRESTWLYAVRDHIACLLADEAISLTQLDIE